MERELFMAVGTREKMAGTKVEFRQEEFDSPYALYSIFSMRGPPSHPPVSGSFLRNVGSV